MTGAGAGGIGADVGGDEVGGGVVTATGVCRVCGTTGAGAAIGGAVATIGGAGATTGATGVMVGGGAGVKFVVGAGGVAPNGVTAADRLCVSVGGDAVPTDPDPTAVGLLVLRKRPSTHVGGT